MLSTFKLSFDVIISAFWLLFLNIRQFFPKHSGHLDVNLMCLVLSAVLNQVVLSPFQLLPNLFKFFNHFKLNDIIDESRWHQLQSHFTLN